MEVMQKRKPEFMRTELPPNIKKHLPPPAPMPEPIMEPIPDPEPIEPSKPKKKKVKRRKSKKTVEPEVPVDDSSSDEGGVSMPQRNETVIDERIRRGGNFIVDRTPIELQESK